MFEPDSFDNVPASYFCGDKVFQSGSLQLFAQPGNIDGQSVFLHIAVILPESRHQLITADDLSFLLHQRLQDAKFIAGQLNTPALKAQ